MYYLSKMRKRNLLAASVAVLSVLSALFYETNADEPDPVLKFYVSQADSAFVRTSLSNPPVNYSFVALTYFKSIGRKGVVSRLDSTVARYFCSGATVDSAQTLVESKGKIPELTFSYPDVFTEDYGHNFFPNDIGQQDLAIGFDSYSDPDTFPSGIAVIDRENYLLRRLYLFYPNPEGYKRLTRSFRLAEFGKYIFPDSIWEVGAKHGIFTTEYYRLETGIEQIQLLR